MVSCGEAGIMGPVVGTMGTLQAGEAIRILSRGLHLSSTPSSASGDTPDDKKPDPAILLIYSYDFLAPPSFRSVKMGFRRKNCLACGENSAETLSLDKIKAGTPNYVQFCSVASPTHNLPPENRITASEYHEAQTRGELPDHLLLDIRDREHFSFGSIDGAVNLPFNRLLVDLAVCKRTRSSPDQVLPKATTKSNDGATTAAQESESLPPLFVVCRRGLDSQVIVEKLKEAGVDRGGKRKVVDIVGGMEAWKKEVDASFPFI